VEPESEEMNTSVRIESGVDGPQVGETGMPVDDERGEESERRCWAVRRGPIVLVFRWWAKVWNVLWVLAPDKLQLARLNRGRLHVI
jgi:hypothetical protein